MSTSFMCRVLCGFVVACTVGLVLYGCAAHGRLAIDPDRRFAGLRDIELDLPPGGTLNIVLVHGMRADEPQTFADLVSQLGRRLQLGAVRDQQTYPLVTQAPTVTLDGEPLFDARNWKTFEPQLTIERYQTRSGGTHVNFYIFEYWRALAYIKCRFVIAPDAAVIGKTTRSDYCQQSPWSATSATRLSGKPESANRWLKSEILEWGLSDAVIATSQYRNVLREAVGEALQRVVQDVAARTPAAAAALNAPEATAPTLIPPDYEERFAFVTESLGSYVISDALNAIQATAAAQSAPGATHDPEVTQRALQRRRAAEFAVCGATQVHMLANQLALLRLSEIAVASGPPSPAEPTAPSAAGHETRPHFFAGCPSGQSKEDQSRRGVKFGARQIVAYHEPNDLLSYYTSDRPGTVGDANADTTNVVKPYATVWVPFIVADPMQAHTGQPKVPAIMDLVACGYDPQKKAACRTGL